MSSHSYITLRHGSVAFPNLSICSLWSHTLLQQGWAPMTEGRDHVLLLENKRIGSLTHPHSHLNIGMLSPIQMKLPYWFHKSDLPLPSPASTWEGHHRFRKRGGVRRQLALGHTSLMFGIFTPTSNSLRGSKLSSLSWGGSRGYHISICCKQTLARSSNDF